MKVLVIDDNVALCRSMQITIEEQGHEVSCAHTAADGLRLFEERLPGLAFIDLNLPDRSGLDVLREVCQSGTGSLAVMITGAQDMKATIEAVRLGAYDYIRKPLDLDAVLVTIEKACHHFSEQKKKNVTPIQTVSDHPREIVGASPAIINVIKLIGLLSESRIPVLILGESGTGKELVARALHEASTPKCPFVAINCSSMVPTLLESELFGHVRGAFTGAEHEKIGRLELAAEGTIFFDEIGDLPLDLQGKLLRTVQEREFERVGSTKTISLRARIIAATLRDLESMVKKGQFREDLYYRIAVATIAVPSLRERRNDIPMLVEHLLASISLDLHKLTSGIEERAVRRLQAYDWPGNVRELENVLTRAVLHSRDPVLTDKLIAESLGQYSQSKPVDGIKTLRDAEKEHVEAALVATGWNISQTAALLDISPTTLRKKIGDYNLAHPERVV
jgi:two-component system response regulator AtoC